MGQRIPFLKAEWRKLAMANYVVDPEILKPYLPPKTELDTWNDRNYVSLVGFMFLNTAIKGIRVPLHTNFEEVNLRFYVKYSEGDTVKRGVVFIKEIVPKPMLSFVANTIYKENYETMPMSHSWIFSSEVANVEYRWKKKDWNIFGVSTEKKPVPIQSGSEEEFITEHYWGYTKVEANRSLEYEVAHPKWDVYPMRTYKIDVDFGNVYGPAFGFLSNQKPVSVFLAEGSEIAVNDTRKI